MSPLKSVWKLIVFLLPILIVYGIFRYFAFHDDPNADVNFLPTYAQLVRAWSSAPDWGLLIGNDVLAVASFYNAGVKTFSDASVQVTDLISFFQAFGKFFEGIWQFLQMFGQVFVLIWHAIEIPFKAILWFFSVFVYPEAMGDINLVQQYLG